MKIGVLVKFVKLFPFQQVEAEAIRAGSLREPQPSVALPIGLSTILTHLELLPMLKYEN